jgi:hypothetical protein
MDTLCVHWGICGNLPTGFLADAFAAANRLWTNSSLRPDQYAQPVLALIALRQMEAKFETLLRARAATVRNQSGLSPASRIYDFPWLTTCLG